MCPSVHYIEYIVSVFNFTVDSLLDSLKIGHLKAVFCKKKPKNERAKLTSF
jgi:hypothetical protein